MMEILATAVNNNMYFLLVWPAIYAVVFCVAGLLIGDGIKEDEKELALTGLIILLSASLIGLFASISFCGNVEAFLKVFWIMTGLLTAAGVVSIPIKRLLVWLGKKTAALARAQTKRMSEGVRVARRKLADRKKAKREGKVESAKDIRKKAALYLAELEDDIPTEFVEARALAKQMATDAVELLLARRNRHLHNLERLVHDAKRYNGASEGSVQAATRDTLRSGARENRRSLAEVVKKLNELLCFLDGKAEVEIRRLMDSGRDEAAIVQLLRDYCDKNKIALTEPLPNDPARLAAVREVEELAEKVERAANGVIRAGGSTTPVSEPDKRRQQAVAAARAKTTS